MSDRHIALNRAQLPAIILNPKNIVDVWGRGTGKSFLIGWDIDRINKQMPRSITAITAKTYGQAMTRTLPSTFKFLEKLGYYKNYHYVINQIPKYPFKDPYEKVLKYDNFITFINGTGYMLLTQDRAGSARGPNVDYEIVDEALTIDKQRYDEESSPTNRGNEEIFGTKCNKPVSFHHGYHYVSSMPISSEGKWLLEAGEYYEKDAGIRIFDIWNRVVKMQVDLLDIDNPKEFKDLWNEIRRIRQQIIPFAHVDPKTKDTTLFTLANAFDNLDNVGLKYIRNQYLKSINLKFMIEIMNVVMDQIEDCYYNIDNDKHIYYNSYNSDFIRGVAEDTQYDFNRLGEIDSRNDADCDTNRPLNIVIDWGSAASFLIVLQEQSYDYVSRIFRNTDNAIKEFFVKPERGHVMIDDLVDEFHNYYSTHKCKEIYYYKDKHGDINKANTGKTYNEQFIDRLSSKGWSIITMEHTGQEPPHHDKYLLWGYILKENNPVYPSIRFNGNNCKYLLISMKNTKVIDKDNKFEKDKSSEHKNSGISPEEATHLSDAIDKYVWAKYGQKLKPSSTFIPTRH